MIRDAMRADRRLRARFHRQLRRSGVLDTERSVLVALSGGLDSVCLLHLLRFAPCAPRLVAAHLDHRMRPGSSADADWVRGLCRAWMVPVVCEFAAVPPRGEADARVVRYAFLERAADESRTDIIATAHHADDQAETVLFRLLRGTGLTGLAGIAARRGRIVRPLLPFTRAQLFAYARACGINWRDDPSNRDLRYARNRIRHQIMPLLEALQPGAAARIGELAARAAHAESAWNDLVVSVLQDVVIAHDGAAFTLARDRLLVYHPHVRARALRHLLRELGSRPGRVGTGIALEFAVAGTSGARVELAGGITLRREFGHLILARAPAAEPDDEPLVIPSARPGSGACRVGGRGFRAQWETLRSGIAPAGPPGHARASERMTAASGEPSSNGIDLDAAALRFPLVLRGWRVGDRIRLSYGRKKLKELFRERGIGRSARAGIPILSDADDNVLWAAGLAHAHGVSPVNDHAFRITITDDDSS